MSMADSDHFIFQTMLDSNLFHVGGGYQTLTTLSGQLTGNGMVQGVTTDSQTVLFSTSATQYNSPVVQSNNSSPAAGAPPRSAASATLCSLECIKAIDILCYIRHACWTSLGQFAALFGGTALAGAHAPSPLPPLSIDGKFSDGQY